MQLGDMGNGGIKKTLNHSVTELSQRNRLQLIKRRMELKEKEIIISK